MKHYFYLSLMILLCCVVFAHASDARNLSLDDIFTSPECQRACWLGIEPDVTTKQEAVDILEASGLIPNEIPELRAVSFKVEPTFPFIGELFNSGMVRFAYDRVDQIELPVNITLEQIRSAYGIPDRIIDRDDDVFQIVYASEGLVFETSDPNPDQIFRMYVTNNYWLSSEYVAQPNFSTLMTDCAQTPFLCDLLPSSDARFLKDTFKSEGCQRACWLGIEPGITTRAEVEQILSPHQITYRVESFGGDLGNANDADLYMWVPQNDGFINNNNGISEATIFFRNEIAVKIYLPVQIPVSIVTQAYGRADWVKVDSDKTLYDAVYEDEGLIFNLSSSLSPDITHISLEPSEALVDLYMPTRECVLSDLVCRQFLRPADAQALRGMLFSAECTQACFFGMQPGVTTVSELKQILEYEGFSYEVFSRPDVADVYEITIDQDGSTIDYPFNVVDIFFGFPDVVNHVWISMDEMPIEDVVDVFGPPTEVRIEPDGRALHMLYPSQGLVFVSNKLSPKRDTAGLVQIMAEDRILELYGSDISLFSSPTCVLAIMCSIPTATPMPR